MITADVKARCFTFISYMSPSQTLEPKYSHTDLPVSNYPFAKFCVACVLWVMLYSVFGGANNQSVWIATIA